MSETTSEATFATLAEAMRAGMRRMAQGVCVVSTIDAHGVRHAMTASSVTSLSNDPPSLLVCVHQQASLHAVLAASAPFCINVLGAGMQEISRRCADLQLRAERFAVGDWHAADSGVPYLADAEANFFCIPDASLQYGTHLICIGRLTSVKVRAGEPTPLIYLDGRYR